MRCLCSLGRWPAPVEVQEREAMRQLAQGHSLSHLIYTRSGRVKHPWLVSFVRPGWERGQDCSSSPFVAGTDRTNQR